MLVEIETPKQKFQVLSELETKILQRVRLSNKFFTTRQIFQQKFYNASDFELRILTRVKF